MIDFTKLHKVISILICTFFIFMNAYSQQKNEYAPYQVIIKFKKQVPLLQKSGVKQNLKAKTTRKLKTIGAEVWDISGISVEQAVEEYSRDPQVEYIEPNYMVYALDIIPNDPDFSKLWGLHNTGQTGGTEDADIDAPEAWSVHTGNKILVGVIDSGVDWAHEDLADNIWINPEEIPDNNIDDDGNGYIDDVRGWNFAYDNNDPLDEDGHGTHIAGIIAGAGNNGIGITGVNWAANILPIKFFYQGGGYASDAILALEYATMMGAKITNNSWGSYNYSKALYDAIKAAGDSGCLFITAAGNESLNNDQKPSYPSNYDLDNIIAVASTDSIDQISSFSNWGHTSVDMGAPGSSIYSTLPGNSYGTGSGTSMAAPYVSGAVSLVWSYVPELTNLQIKRLIMNSVDQIPSMNGKTVSGGRLNIYNSLFVIESDSIPPAPITDLFVTEIGSNWIMLNWTASGDNGNTGIAYAYDLRYATFQINNENFNSATKVSGLPAPHQSGSPETFKIRGLECNTTYFFAVRVSDLFNNISEVSNSPSCTTLGTPDIHVSPAWLYTDLLVGETDTKILTIKNTGKGILDFAFPKYTVQLLLKAAGILGVKGSNQKLQKESGTGKNDKEKEQPVVFSGGGPDNFGYTWIDSDEPGGPVFNWFDISEIGTNSGLNGEDNYVTIDIPFDFEFYGEVKHNVKVSTNGYLTFGLNGTDHSNDPIPDPGEPDDYIAAYWGDELYFESESQNYYYYDESNQRFIIQYSFLFDNHEFIYEFQIHLCENKDIYIYYLSIPDKGYCNSTIGIENKYGIDGLQIAYEKNYAHSNLAVYISKNPPPFLSLSPTFGSILSGTSMDIEVLFDASGIPDGYFENEILISSNDPDEALLTIPAYLNVTGAPDIKVNTDTLNYGSALIGYSVTKTLTISNKGTDTLRINNILSNHSNFSPDTTNFFLDPGGRQNVSVEFTPDKQGNISGTLTITSNDPDEPVVKVSLVGTGRNPPNIILSQESFNLILTRDEIFKKILTVTNKGKGHLDFSFPRFANPGISGSPGIQNNSNTISKRDAGSEKRQNADRKNQPVLYNKGGPDNFGYTWISSDDPEGPAFQWEDISSSGNAVYGFSSGSYLGPLPISFPFPFYDSLYTEFYIQKNGVINFDDRKIGFGSGIPYAEPGEWNNLIAWFWEDLIPLSPVYYQDFGNRLVIQVAELFYLTPSDYSTLEAQIILYPSGKILLQYIDASNVEDAGLIGIENVDGTDGLSICCNVPHNNLAIQISFKDKWLSINPASGTVQPDALADIDLIFNAADISNGNYNRNLLLWCNDPENPQIKIPIYVQVTNAPDISVNPDTLNFRSVFIGASITKTLIISNEGNEILAVSNISSDNKIFTVSNTDFSLYPEETKEVSLTFAPNKKGWINSTLIIKSNDPNEPTRAVHLKGRGVNPPDIELIPDSFSEILIPGETLIKNLTIDNSKGKTELRWKIQMISVPGTNNTINESYSGTLLNDNNKGNKENSDQYSTGSSDLTGKKILMDNSHGQGNYSNWSVITGDLKDRGAAVTKNTNSITLSLLNEYDILWTKDIKNNLSSSEITAIQTWINEGGSLILEGDDNKSVVNYNNLLSALGAGIKYSKEDGTFGETTNILPHETTIDVKTLDLHGNRAHLSDVTSPGSVLINDIAGVPNTAYSIAGSGRIIATADEIFNDNHIKNADNRLFANQVMYWLLIESPVWVTVSPDSGYVDPGDSEEIEVRFDAAGLHRGEYYANIIVTSNDPDEPEKIVHINLEIIDGITITLNSGWNLVSWNIDTKHDTLTAVLEPIIDSLIVATSFEKEGLTYDPSVPVEMNTLINTDHLHGYELMMKHDAELIIRGTPADEQTPIMLEKNWNLVSYLPSEPDSAAHAIQSVIDNTIVVLGYEDQGLTFDPDLSPEFNTLNIMKPSLGYWIMTIDPDTLIYPEESVVLQGQLKNLVKSMSKKARIKNVKPTKEWISLWGQNIKLNGELLPAGTTVKAVDKDDVICGQCIVRREGTFGLMSIYRDDPRTKLDEGANPGEHVFIYFDEYKVSSGITWTHFGDVINFDQILGHTSSELSTLPREYALNQNYPNPFNSITTINYDLPEATKVTIKIFDILGKEISTIVDARHEAGQHTVKWNGKASDGKTVPTGIYFYVIISENFKKTNKMIYIK